MVFKSGNRLGSFGFVELALEFAHFCAVCRRIVNAELLSRSVFFRVLFLNLAGDAGSARAALLSAHAGLAAEAAETAEAALRTLAALTEAALRTLAALTAKSLTRLTRRTLAAHAGLTALTAAEATEAALTRLTRRTLAALTEALAAHALTLRTLSAGIAGNGCTGRKVAGSAARDSDAALTIGAGRSLCGERSCE